MRFRLLLLVALAVAAASVVTGSAAADPTFSALNPGGPANFSERVPVQFVFLGYEPSQVNQSDFLAELPSKYDAVVRSRGFYPGLPTEYVGLHYTYDFKVAYTDTAYENAFFNKLTSLAVPESTIDGRTRTLFQDQYNAETKNVLDVGTNYFIDAPSVEKWLYQNPPAGVDPNRDTVVFVNWYERPDFKFHTYTKFGEPDPDTGYDFGLNRQSRKIIAWGGTGPNDEETGFGATSRLWFYDLSAGPESWTDNWNVDDADVDGDGTADYRMPPTWEYFANGYHKLSQLSRDLGKVARYDAINLLFTSSPLYPPYITPNRQPASINLDLNFFQLGGVTGTQYETTDLLVHEVNEVHRISYNTDSQNMPVTQELTNCYQLWLYDARCYPDRPQYPGFANLFLYNAIHKAEWRDGSTPADYEAGFFNFATNDRQSAPFLGFADDNWIDGTQSGTFNFISPAIVSLGYGLTTTQIHEYGHHFGMSHPHDGYDSETGVDYGPAGPYYFAWSGDEVNSMMSYIDLNWDYSQLDLDNANRVQATAYMKVANAIAADVLASATANKGFGDLQRADTEFAAAQTAMAAHEYVGTFDHAKRGYEYVRSAAAKAGVGVNASDHGWDLLAPVHGGKSAKRDYAWKDPLAGTRRVRP